MAGRPPVRQTQSGRAPQTRHSAEWWTCSRLARCRSALRSCMVATIVTRCGYARWLLTRSRGLPEQKARALRVPRADSCEGYDDTSIQSATHIYKRSWMSRFRVEAVSRMCWRVIPPRKSSGSTFRRRVWMHAPASGWLKKAVSRRDRRVVNECPTLTVATTGERGPNRRRHHGVQSRTSTPPQGVVYVSGALSSRSSKLTFLACRARSSCTRCAKVSSCPRRAARSCRSWITLTAAS